MVLLFISLYSHLSCIYTEGQRPFLLIRAVSWRKQSKLTQKHVRTSPLCLQPLTFIHTFTQMCVFILGVTSQEHFHAFVFHSSPLFHFCCYFILFFSFFPISCFVSIFPVAFYYTAKVTFMPPPCLKPNAPGCQRAQLCEDKWTWTLNFVNSQRVLQNKTKANFSECQHSFFFPISSIRVHVHGL